MSTKLLNSIVLKASTKLNAIFIIVWCGLASFVLTATLSLIIKFLLVLTLSIVMILAIGLHGMRKFSNAIIEIEQLPEYQWKLRTVKGDEWIAILAAEAFVSASLIILNFKRIDSNYFFRTKNTIIFRDSLSFSQFRRLKSVLTLQ